MIGPRVVIFRLRHAPGRCEPGQDAAMPLNLEG